ncbi:MAG: UvrD-helicase domain-containing protein [Prevotella sp.]|nr:UvrD-helicase domain-containing protein [Prevotella sp.]
MNILENLNENQRAAVEYCDGPQLVIAGAGSGKTRVLTFKIAYLLDYHKMKPWNILALTFTNKAAAEMKERVSRIGGLTDVRYLNMGTFHSVFSRILRAEAEKLGYNSNFTIYDQSDSRSLIKSIVKEMALDDKVYKASTIGDTISMAKNRLITSRQYASDIRLVQADAMRKMPELSNIYIRYADRCRQANAMDFDDLLLNTYLLFANHEDVRLKYADRFKYVLVDEYQDTNYAQQTIVLQLTKEHHNVCVVGDDAQSIYGFRGANIDNILNFNKFYSDAKMFKLEQNYRSTQLIVKAANSLISHNQHQIPKEVFSENDSGEKLVLKHAYSDKEEAVIVCNEIKRIRRIEKCDWSDFAILYRTNSQSRSFEEYMLKEGIPYRIFGGLSFYQRKEIKDTLAYFRVVANPDDEEALKRIINYPTRGIGDTTLNKIINAATSNNVSLWSVLSQPSAYNVELNKGTLAKLDAFRQLVGSWIERLSTDDAYTLGHAIVTESGISKDIYSGREPEDLSRQQNLEEFLGGMQDFVETRKEEGLDEHISMSDYLQEVALLTDLDDSDKDSETKVSLMTVHSAKGLEFPTVFIVGLEENIFPSPMSCNSMRELEEERRLLYVAITRAEKHCIMTTAQNRFRYGRVEFDTPSRFIKDIDKRFISVESSGGGESRFSSHSGSWMQNPRPVATQFKADPRPRLVGATPSQPPVDPFSDSFKRQLRKVSSVSSSYQSTSIPSNGTLTSGMTIEHQRFGIGKVLKVEGSGENQKATVEFRNVGTKQLLLKFAKYKII